MIRNGSKKKKFMSFHEEQIHRHFSSFDKVSLRSKKSTYLPSLVFRHFALEIWSQWLNNSVRLTIDVKIHKCVFKMRLKKTGFIFIWFSKCKNSCCVFCFGWGGKFKILVHYQLVTETCQTSIQRKFQRTISAFVQTI